VGTYNDVYELAAKLGSLEGYLYQRPDADPQYLPNWLGNIQRMWAELPSEARNDCQAKHAAVLKSVAEHLAKVVGLQDSNYLLLQRILAEVERGQGP
jgi:hypothetical protein